MKKLFTLLSLFLLMAFSLVATLPVFGHENGPLDPVPKSKHVVDQKSVVEMLFTCITTEQARPDLDVGDMQTIQTDNDINYLVADVNVLTFNMERPCRSVAIYYGAVHRSPLAGFDHNIRPPNQYTV